MSNIELYRSRYEVEFFDEKMKTLAIDEQQKEALKSHLNSVKFVEIDGNLINTSAIKMIKQVRERVAYRVLEDQTFLTENSWNEAIKSGEVVVNYNSPEGFSLRRTNGS